MVEKPVTVTTAPSEPAAAEPTPAAMPSEPAKTPPEAAPAEAETPAHAPGAPQSADNPQSMDQTKAVEPAQPAEAAGPAEPSVDVVRIDPDGSVVIAGRAAPNADLIILDNGAPIGTATADSFGEWIFIPDLPLPSGGHAFGLVVKSIKGRMSVPAPGEGEAAPQEEPAKPDSEANAVPIPPRKPIPAGDTDFTVQLASVETKAGAAREWQVLKDRFPRILGGMKVSLDKAKVGGSGTAVRVRTGGFATLRDAIDLCARLTAKRQECLVIREPLAN